MELLEILLAVARALTLVVLYLVLGFGPGFIVGLLLANRFVGHGKPLRIDSHEQNIQKAGEHNKQWNPAHQRWE